MNIGQLFAWNKNYTVFNTEGHLETRSLNFFQRILRHVGFHRETRLATVAKLAQAACFKPDSNFTPLEKERIVAIICKAQESLKVSRYFHLGTEKLSDGETVRYEATITDRDRVNLYVNLIKANQTYATRIARISLQGIDPNSNKRNVMMLEGGYQSTNPFHNNNNDSAENLLVRRAYLFLAKVMNDTQKIQQVTTTLSVKGASLAQKYGWTNIDSSTYKKDSYADLDLNRANAVKFSRKCQLNVPVSLDFFS
jgi:hypothetical protein